MSTTGLRGARNFANDKRHPIAAVQSVNRSLVLAEIIELRGCPAGDPSRAVGSANDGSRWLRLLKLRVRNQLAEYSLDISLIALTGKLDELVDDAEDLVARRIAHLANENLGMASLRHTLARK